MADVVARALSKSKVFAGRLVAIKVYNSVPEVSLHITGLAGATVNATEEVRNSEIELENGTEISEKAGRRVVAEATISEVDTSDMALINAASKIVFVTSTGGSGSGMSFTITSPDEIYCHLDGLKTKIVAKKSTTHPTLPYVIANV
jgi:hypothetical protein